MVPRRLSAFVVAVLALGAPHRAAAVVNCSTVPSSDCTTTACATDCTEAALRSAVANANACASVPAFNRTITFAFPGCDGCTVNLAQALGSTATCADDSVREGGGAICITGHHITIDGQGGVLFNYSGDVPCASCPLAFRPPPNGSPMSELCRGHNPGLFTVRGHHNTVKNFTMQYFPEGIIIRNDGGVAAHDNAVTGVTSTATCNKGITIDSVGSGGSGHIIAANSLTGDTAPASGHSCYEEFGCGSNSQCVGPGGCYGNTSSGTCGCLVDSDCHSGERCRCPDGQFSPTGNCTATTLGTCYAPSTCGRRGIIAEEGEALIGGASAANGNTLLKLREPLSLDNGAYEARNNTINGLLDGCPAYPGSCTSSFTCTRGCVAGIRVSGSSAVLEDNTVEYCTSAVSAGTNPSPTVLEGNLLRFNYSTAASVASSVIAQGNRLKSNGCSTHYSTGVPYRRGTVSAVLSNTVIDFGGGSLGSSGGNSFCGDNMTIYDANNSAGGTVTMTNNCFDDAGTPTPNLIGTVTTAPASLCTAPGFASCASF